MNAPRGIDSADLANRFGYHPANDTSRPKHEELRRLYFELADRVAQIVPPGRELSLAVTALEESVMWANAGVARVEPRG